MNELPGSTIADVINGNTQIYSPRTGVKLASSTVMHKQVSSSAKVKPQQSSINAEPRCEEPSFLDRLRAALHKRIINVNLPSSTLIHEQANSSAKVKPEQSSINAETKPEEPSFLDRLRAAIYKDIPNVKVPSTIVMHEEASSSVKLTFEQSSINSKPIPKQSNRNPPPIPQQSGRNAKVMLEQSGRNAKRTSSFDNPPSDSPPYRYKRGPVRKRVERNKLPGQDCDYCYRFYEAKRKAGWSEEKIQRLKDKCSRHRDKYPIRANTPPWFWNPVFSDSE